MKLPALRRLVKEDFQQKDKELVGKIAQVLNPATENLSLALNNNLTFSDNISCAVVTVPITVDANGIPVNPTSFPVSLSAQANHIFVTRAVNATNATTYVTAAPFVDWVESSGSIVVNHVTGLPANNTFNLTMIVAI
jgi:hypothetical protein